MPGGDEGTLSAASYYKATECESVPCMRVLCMNLLFPADGNDDPYDMKVPACKSQAFPALAITLTI